MKYSEREGDGSSEFLDSQDNIRLKTQYQFERNDQVIDTIERHS